MRGAMMNTQNANRMQKIITRYQRFGFCFAYLHIHLRVEYMGRRPLTLEEI